MKRTGDEIKEVHNSLVTSFSWRPSFQAFTGYCGVNLGFKRFREGYKMDDRESSVYMAKLAEQAERYEGKRIVFRRQK